MSKNNDTAFPSCLNITGISLISVQPMDENEQQRPVLISTSLSEGRHASKATHKSQTKLLETHSQNFVCKHFLQNHGPEYESFSLQNLDCTVKP